MHLNIKYLTEVTESEQEVDNTFVEKQVIYNRKVPKNARLKIKLNYFKYDENFMKIYDLKNKAYFFSIEPFGEDKTLNKVMITKYNYFIEVCQKAVIQKGKLRKWNF